MKKLFAMALLGCALVGGSAAWSAPSPDATERYLAELQGSVQGANLEMLKKAPATVSFEDRTFKLNAVIRANLMPPVAPGRDAGVSIEVSEVKRQHLPAGSSLDFLWLVSGKDVWFRDLRQVPERPMTCRWYTFEKDVQDAPLTFAQGENVQAVVGIRTATGKVLVLRAKLNQQVCY
jgi:hypothetical protein